jgi:Meckel syndrome type 1 protein
LGGDFGGGTPGESAIVGWNGAAALAAGAAGCTADAAALADCAADAAGAAGASDDAAEAAELADAAFAGASAASAGNVNNATLAHAIAGQDHPLPRAFRGFAQVVALTGCCTCRSWDRPA